MKIVEVTDNKKKYLDLLLLADEQEDMVDRYLEKGKMYALLEDDGTPIGEAVVVDLGTTDEGRTFEIKNIATDPAVHGKGYGRKLIEYIMDRYADDCDLMLVGTGDSPLTVPFYKKCGFNEHHRLKNFFTDNYDHPIFEEGIQLVDMVYLAQKPGKQEEDKAKQ